MRYFSTENHIAKNTVDTSVYSDYYRGSSGIKNLYKSQKTKIQTKNQKKTAVPRRRLFLVARCNLINHIYAETLDALEDSTALYSQSSPSSMSRVSRLIQTLAVAP